MHAWESGSIYIYIYIYICVCVRIYRGCLPQADGLSMELNSNFHISKWNITSRLCT